MAKKPNRLATETTSYPEYPCENKGKHVQVNREIPENIQASSLEELRSHLEEEIDHDLQVTYELTDERLECTLWSLENETEEVERRRERLDRKLEEIKVPGEDE